MAATETFEELYKEVFDADGNIKACGRNKCIALIQEASKIDKDVCFGSITFGMMDKDNIITLMNKISGKVSL